MADLRAVWVGDVIEDRYLLERPVGSGGMGSVFFAADRASGRSVAVKVLHNAGAGAIDRFRREARILSELAHPCIVRYVAHGETTEREPFLVMEWLEGEDLRTRLATAPLAVDEALVIARRVADGLAHAHARGVVHRDVKPSNVLLTGRDPRRAMLIDFGVARVAATHVWTRTGVVLGTVGYMAPEQARGEGETDARADVFGLGCVLFECLTGKPAFAGPHDLRARMPAAKVAIATGTADTGSDVAIGPVIDRVALLMAEAEAGRIGVDEVTAGLLPARFVVSEQSGKRVLERAVALDDEPRPLMGRRTPCVGRERELGMLDGFLEACILEPYASAVIVVGEAGMGKTRLRQEFVARAKKRHPSLRVLFARGELVAAGSPLAVARQLVRSAFELTEMTPEAKASLRIRTALERIVVARNAEDRLRAGDFIGELVGVRHPEPPSIPLQASREDARLMAEWLRRCFVEWLGALSNASPILIVVDDLHWTDPISLAWLDEALRTHSEAPLGVLGLGRPELRDRLKPLPEQQEIALLALRRRAAEDLVRSALPLARDEDVRQLVERAGGNAFYLEELARHFASGASDLPATVLAMAQARLEEIDPAGRAVLRAASVFGERFWSAGVEAILEESGRDAPRWLELLASDELVARSPTSRLAATDEYVFRHAVVREAAYTSLKEGDRSAAHLLAARWLEPAGEKDVMAMVGHFERAGAAQEGLHWYVVAVRTATQSAVAEPTSWNAVIEMAQRALPYAQGRPERGALLAWLSYGCAMVARVAEARTASIEALEIARIGSSEWSTALTALCQATNVLGDSATPAPYIQRLVTMAEDPEPSWDTALCLMNAFFTAVDMGERSLSKTAFMKLERLGDAVGEQMPLVEAVRQTARSMLARTSLEWFSRGAASAHRATTIGRAAGHYTTVDMGRIQVIRFATYFGHLDQAQAELEAGFVNPLSNTYAPVYRATLAVAENDLAAAEQALRDAAGARRSEISIRPLLALLYADAGRCDDAAQLVGELPSGAEAFCVHHASFHMARARIALAGADAEGALLHCGEGERAAERWGCYVIVRQLLALTRAEALEQAGRADEARRTLHALRNQIHEIASRLDGPTQTRYLTHGFPSARILRVANDCLGDA